MSFWFVQRLKVADRDKPGFDGMFELDYMGSSEFEFGAAYRSLTAIRDQPVTITAVDIAMDAISRPVFFVGNLTPELRADFEEWITWDGHRRCPGKERSRFEDAFLFAEPLIPPPDAWWSFDGDIMFALDAAIAARLFLGITGEEWTS